MVVLAGLAGACARPNGGFQDTDGAPTEGTTTGPQDAGTGQPPTSDGPEPTTDTPPSDSSSGDGSTAPSDTTAEESTGQEEESQVVLFQGPWVWGDALAKAGVATPGFIDGICEKVHAVDYADIPCETGHVWGLLGGQSNPLDALPLRVGGQVLESAPIFAPDEQTVVALDYDHLLQGDLEVPLLGSVVYGKEELQSLWWGHLINGAPGPDCSGWSTFAGEGSTIDADAFSTQLAFGFRSCDQELPVLCLCF